MSFLLLPVLVVCAVVPLIASAASGQSSPTPLQSDAAVPAVTYRSAFHAYQPVPEPAQTPDKVWRAANETVGALKGHAGHMKTPASADGDSPAPVTPSGYQHGHH